MSAADSTVVALQPLQTSTHNAEPSAAGFNGVSQKGETQDDFRPPQSHQELENRLAADAPPHETFELLRFAEALPPRSIDVEVELQALRRLVRADSVFLRSAAYRWLAGLYAKDLRYEMRAKRVLSTGLERESGLSRSRVLQLLRRC